jgi:hypothetical protein
MKLLFKPNGRLIIHAGKAVQFGFAYPGKFAIQLNRRAWFLPSLAYGTINWQNQPY